MDSHPTPPWPLDNVRIMFAGPSGRAWIMTSTCGQNMNVHMCGSYEEIATANRQKKPILVWCEQGKMLAPNWLFFMLPHEQIFSSMDEVLTYLKVINEDHKPYDLKRWFFFEDSIVG